MTEKKPFIHSLVDGYLDQNVYQDVLKNHAKEAISLINFGNVNITNLNSEIIEQIQSTETEISPFHKYDIDCSAIDNAHQRRPSRAQFSEQKLEFLKIQELLVHGFSADKEGRRPYPSAGALYPIEPLVFLFPERLLNFEHEPSGCYHFRAISKTLQLIKRMPIDHFFNKLLHGSIRDEKRPCFGILYVASIGKAIFKYRYRGYRHAVMEVGSMYQSISEQSQKMGLSNTVWSTFADHEMLFALDLDYGSYVPLTMQFFGYEESL